MKNSYLIIYKLFFQKKYYAYFVIFLSFISILFESISYASILPLIESFLDKQNSSNLSRMISKCFHFIGLTMDIFTISILFIILIFLKNFTKIAREYFVGNFKYLLREEWIKSIYSSFYKSDFENVSKENRGKIYNNIYHETLYSTQGIENLIEIFTSSLSIFIFTIILLMTSFQFSIIIGISGLVIFALNKLLLQNYSKKVGNKEVELNQSVSSTINDSLVAFKNIKIFNAMDDFSNHLGSQLSYLRKILVQWRVFTFSTMPIIETILVFVLIIFILSSKNNTSDLSLLIPILALIVVVGQRLMQQLSRLLIAINSYNRMKKSLFIISESMQFHDQNKIKSSSAFIKNNKLNKINQDIEIQNLNFSYKNNHKIFDNLNIKFKKGKITLIKGESGVGKSTLLELLLGILVPDSGAVKINNIDIHSYNNLSEKILSVSQKNILFTDTIKSNILFFKENIDENFFLKVCKGLNIDSFVSNLDLKYNTLIQNSGENLSGGQTQRICIARALLRSPELLILDEISSSLDKKNEKDIFQSIFNIMKNKTIIISIHKDFLDDMADEIFKVSNNSIIQIK